MNCRPVLIGQECATTAMSGEFCHIPQGQEDHPRVIELVTSISALNTSANFVCREHIDGTCSRQLRNRSYSKTQLSESMSLSIEDLYNTESRA